MDESVEMPSNMNNGQRAIVREIAFEVVKTYQAEHAKERKLELELMTGDIMAEVRTERLADITKHGNDELVPHKAGRLKTWGPAILVGIGGVAFGAGIRGIPEFVTWIARLTAG